MIKRRPKKLPLRLDEMEPDQLKEQMMRHLISLTRDDRARFVAELESELRAARVNLRAYLIPLGIVGRSPEDLTPSEVAHLVRYFKINVPAAVPHVFSVCERWGFMTEEALI